jgi:hypothetical protein
MRAYLLTGTALLGLSLVAASPGFAQALAPAPTGTASNMYFTAPADNISVDTTGDTDGQTLANPTPGQVIVRLNGRFRFYAGMFDDQDLNRTAVSGTTVTQNKQANYGFTEYTRLYPGFDGMTAGGIKYGASVEIRQDDSAAPGGGDAGSVSGADVYRGGLYVRREWGYIGTADLGTLRFGTIDDVSSLYLTGVLENFNDGGWNGDVRYGLASNAQLRWPFPDDGSEYATNKIVYLSPSFAGFDFGASFEPSSAGANIDDGNCANANTANTVANSAGGTSPANGISDVGCDRLESTTVAAEAGRRRNTVDALLRYRVALGNGIGFAATASYTGGGHVNYVGPYYTSSEGKYTLPVTYNGLSMADFGAQLTYAGILIGGNYQVGRFSNALASGSSQSFSLEPVGGKQANAWSAGAQYTFGPAIIGASWVSTDSTGAFAYAAGKAPNLSVEIPGLGQRHEEGLNAGGTLKVAPGLGVFLSYLWDERKQSGYNFDTSAIVAGTATPNAGSQIRAQALTLGTSLTW